MIKTLISLILLTPILCQVDNSSTYNNLLANKDISVDKNLGATYIAPKKEIDISNIDNPSIYLKYDKSLIQISNTIEYEKMGFEISYVDKNKIYQEKSFCIASVTITDLFTRYDNYYDFKGDLSTSEIKSINYLPQSKLFDIKLSENIVLFKKLTFYYGDNKLEVDSCYLGKEIENKNTISLLPGYFDSSYSYNLLYTDRINYLESNYGYNLSLSFLKRNYKIIDPSIDKIYEVNDYYFTNNNDNFNNVLLGSHFFIIVSSTVDNVSATIEIIIVDNLYPIIEKWNFEDITLPSGNIDNIKENIDEFFCIKDNFSSGGKLQRKLTTHNEDNISGIYYLLVEALDQNNHLTQNNFLVYFNDLQPPVITKKYSYIITNKNKIITSDELLSYFIIEDRESLFSIVVNKNTYYGNELIPGRYIFEIIATDKKSNSAKASIFIEVKDDDLTLVKNSYKTFYYDYGSKIYLEEIISILITDNIIPNYEYTSYKIIEGETNLNNLEKGIYYFLIELTYDEKNYYEDIIICINNSKSEINEKKLSILDFFRYLIEEIKNIFSRR